MAKNKKVNPNDLTYDEAGVLIHVGASRVGDLVREGKLSRPITVEMLREYQETKGTAGRTSGGARWFHVKVTPEQATELTEQGYTVRDPAAVEKEAAERRRDAAKARLGDLSL